jgi:hypothetical protein
MAVRVHLEERLRLLYEPKNELVSKVPADAVASAIQALKVVDWPPPDTASAEVMWDFAWVTLVVPAISSAAAISPAMVMTAARGLGLPVRGLRD